MFPLIYIQEVDIKITGNMMHPDSNSTPFLYKRNIVEYFSTTDQETKLIKELKATGLVIVVNSTKLDEPTTQQQVELNLEWEGNYIILNYIIYYIIMPYS